MFDLRVTWEWKRHWKRFTDFAKKNMSRSMTEPTKWRAPSEDSDQPGHPPSLIRVFTVHSKDSQGSKASSCGQRRLWSDWANARLIWVFAGCTVVLLVLSCCGLYVCNHEYHTDPEGAVWWGFTLFAIPPAFFMHNCMVKPHSSNLRIITAIFLGDKILWFLPYW